MWLRRITSGGATSGALDHRPRRPAVAGQGAGNQTAPKQSGCDRMRDIDAHRVYSPRPIWM
jgi:hypothetical protein